MGCSFNTIKNEYERGKVLLFNGKVERYKASVGQKTYMENRKNCKKNYSCLEVVDFLTYVENQVKNEGWSLDACVGFAKDNNLFDKDEMVCTKTLYNYVDAGLMNITNMDLPEKLSRNTKTKKVRENKKNLGNSIEERPEEVELREEFGHWETDLVIGSKSGEDNVLLTLLERKTRQLRGIRLPDKRAESVMAVFQSIRDSLGDHFSDVFKTITTDNGSEFARLSELEQRSHTKVYFAHPYSSWEKGSIENHNGLIHRCLPKGKRMDSYSADEILSVELWANALPRKILGYRTPDEAFDSEMDAIYAV